MTITFDEIKNSNPLLMLYPAGSGGEFVSAILANSSESFHNLSYNYSPERNRYNTICPLDYYTNWPDINDTSTWINPNFVKYRNGLRYVIKDHPMRPCFSLYSRYIPELSAIYMSPVHQLEYFSKLIFIKTSVLCNSPISREFILRCIGNKLTDERISKLIDWSAHQRTFWIHELQNANTMLSLGGDINTLTHEPDLSVHIKMHAEYMRKDLESTFGVAKYDIKSIRMLNSDSLASDGREFWNVVKDAIPDLNITNALTETEQWILKNNKLISLYDNNT